jgi:hypothetical protein
MPKVLNKHTDEIPEDAVYCGRGSPYGNPFAIGQQGSRKEVIERFKTEVLPYLDVSALKGKDLVCFCKPKPCHCDLLLEKANVEYIFGGL